MDHIVFRLKTTKPNPFPTMETHKNIKTIYGVLDKKDIKRGTTQNMSGTFYDLYDKQIED